MAQGFDSSVSNLLCQEDSTSFLADGSTQEVVSDTRHHWDRPLDDRQPTSFDPVLQVQGEDCVILMVEKEFQHSPNDEYLNRLRTESSNTLKARTEAIDWIEKAHQHFNFSPLCAYLSVNYLDRFLSAYELPGKAWTMQLLAVACLSIAAKIEENEVPLSLDLQVGESKFIFEGKTIQRMELLVLSTLNWRMHAITPFSFLDYFLEKLHSHKKLPRCIVTQSIQLILLTTKEIDFLEFKPSEIAAAVAVIISRETLINSVETTYVPTQHVQKEKMVKCVEMIHDLQLMSGSVPSIPQSPNGILDAACWSYKSYETDGTSSSSGGIAPDHHCIKRRKLNKAVETEL